MQPSRNILAPIKFEWHGTCNMRPSISFLVAPFILRIFIVAVATVMLCLYLLSSPLFIINRSNLILVFFSFFAKHLSLIFHNKIYIHSIFITIHFYIVIRSLFEHIMLNFNDFQMQIIGLKRTLNTVEKKKKLYCAWVCAKRMKRWFNMQIQRIFKTEWLMTFVYNVGKSKVSGMVNSYSVVLHLCV